MDPVQTFQNPRGDNDPNSVDSMYNSYFSTPGIDRNGTFYCYVGDSSSNLSSPCDSSYDSSIAGLDLQGRMYDFSPQNTGEKNIFYHLI